MREDWQISSLEEVVKFIDYRGKTPQKTEYGMHLITAKNVKMGYLQNKPMEFVDPKIYDEWMTRGIPKKGDVLFTTEAPLGNVAQLDTDEKVIFAQRIIVMQPKREVLDSTFLKYMLLSNLMQKKIHEKGTGATVQGIKSQLLKKVPISFPRSLSEQKRIVAILDEAFEGIDRAIANTEKNLVNARELFESYLNAIFTQKGDGWVDAAIEDRIKFIDYRGRTPNKTEGGMRLITAKNVKMGFLQLEPQEFVNPDIYDNWMTRGIPQKGDVLFTTEAPLGNVAQLDTDEKVVFAQRVIIMQPDEKFINKTFLKFLLLSNIIQQRIQDKGTGATAQGIKASLLKKIPISFPSDLLIQQSIVLKLETIEADTKRLETIYRQKIAALNELKQSILQKAFTGELTADTPKAAKEAIAA
ncbi:restriction endonuclease subunit S [Nostoc sp.]|uniref:restriction endonuclease subunit S n=1 Tax=Nostoc sp. TaxID=1180 RepID=UPI002FFBF3FA